MSEFLETKQRIKTLRGKILRYAAYPATNEERIRECKTEASKLETTLEKMQRHRCLTCSGSGKNPKWFFFWRQCSQCCGDGHLIHVTASKVNDTCY